MPRPYKELFTEDIDAIPWEPVEGCPGMYEKTLVEDPETGSHTRLVKGDPGFARDDQLNIMFTGKMPQDRKEPDRHAVRASGEWRFFRDDSYSCQVVETC